MKFSTTFSTTYFFASFPYCKQWVKALFPPLYIVEGDIYIGLISTKRDLRQ